MSGKGDVNKDEIAGKLRSVFQENSLILTREMTAKDVAKWDSLRDIQMIAEPGCTQPRRRRRTQKLSS
jgi:hypothetical protein